MQVLLRKVQVLLPASRQIQSMRAGTGSSQPSSYSGSLAGLVLIEMLVAVVVAVVVTVMIPAVIPAMVVGDSATLAIPVAFKEALSIMMRFHPACAGERRTGPISGVPFIVVGYRVPVATHPNIIGAGASWLNPKGWRKNNFTDSVESYSSIAEGLCRG